MGLLLEVILNFKSNIGLIDKSDDLSDWLTDFQRFKKLSDQQHDIPYSLQLKIFNDMKFHSEVDVLTSSSLN